MTLLVSAGVTAGFVTVAAIMWHDIDRWVNEWRDHGVDQAFERTRQQIRSLPESGETERGSVGGSNPGASADDPRSVSARPFDWEKDAA